MKILEGMSIEEVRRHAKKPTPPPMAGEWTLTAPNGRQWKGDKPTACLIAEGNERISALTQLARIRMSLEEPEQDEDARRLEVAQRLADALEAMESERADYMLRNSLGNPAVEHTNKMARAALAEWKEIDK